MNTQPAITDLATGYLSDAYAASFRSIGEVVRLPRSGGTLIARRIHDTEHYDLMGLYPLFCCIDWGGLRADLDDLQRDFVCAWVVTDPLGGYAETDLNASFDAVRAFKSHYVTDVSTPEFEAQLSKSHRRLARRALKDVEIDVVANPAEQLDDWMRLYAYLSERHEIDGLRRFSREAFLQQLNTPGMTMFRAVHEGQTVCLDLWYDQGDAAQGHLVAVTETGYRVRASYASKLFLLRYFQHRVRWVNLGGVAGTADDPGGGLAHFKAGWTTARRTAYFCTRVFNRAAFNTLSRDSDPENRFFPPYRQGDF